MDNSTTDDSICGCDGQPGGRLKLIAINLGLSETISGGEKQKDFAKRLCETVMLDQTYRRTCKTPRESAHDCGQANQQQCSTSEPAEEAVVKLIKLMENESSLNCGYGSNLTMCGQVECDASFMSSRTGLWAGVGAVSGCRNPIELVKSIYDQRLNTRPLGLVQPSLLVGAGARKWMRQNCPHLYIPQSHMISSNSLARYQRFKSAYDAVIRGFGQHQSTQADAIEQMEIKLDTVGAIAVDCDDKFSCAISSGGIMLKHLGRVGQACLPGAGCWSGTSTGVVTTGVGELLSNTLLARMFHEQLENRKCTRQLNVANEICISGALDHCFTELAKLIDCNNISGAGRLAGILAVSALESSVKSINSPIATGFQHQRELEYYLTCGHNGKSMCIGYMTGKDVVAKSFSLDRHGGDSHSQMSETIRLFV